MADSTAAASSSSNTTSSSNNENCDIEILPLETETSVTPPRKKKRFQKYKKDYEITFKWVRREDDYTGYCTLCRKSISVSHGGSNDLTSHQKSALHQKNVRSTESSVVLSNFFTPAGSNEDNLTVAAAELTITYHTIMHNLSYSSMDCGNKITKKLYGDSKVRLKLL